MAAPRLLPRFDLCASVRRLTTRPDAAQVLIAKRYERGSIIITSNLSFSDWAGALADDATLTAARPNVGSLELRYLRVEHHSDRFSNLARRRRGP